MNSESKLVVGAVIQIGAIKIHFDRVSSIVHPVTSELGDNFSLRRRLTRVTRVTCFIRVGDRRLIDTQTAGEERGINRRGDMRATLRD